MNNFITNSQTRQLGKRIIELLLKSEEIKILVGFFYFSGLKELYEGLKNNPYVKLKVLAGLNVDRGNYGLIEYAEKSYNISDDERINHFFESLKKSINSEYFDNKEFYEQVKFFIELIKEDRLIIRKTFKPNHSKLYIFKLGPSQIARNALFITGSSNLTSAGLAWEQEFNVEISDYGIEEAEEYFDNLWTEAVRITEDDIIKQRLIETLKNKTLIKQISFYVNQILNIEQNVSKIKRKTLLYKTKVEYGNWTINHVVGCKHGCKFPCYAMMMAKKFGWVKNYEDWRRPRIVENSLELLEEELPKYKNEIDFVHLCFMSDPFMYDYENKELIYEIKELTLKIIERLNKEGIKVTTLTKGIYPDEILNKEKFLHTNEYGITLVSLNNEFKNNFEPFSAPYEERIAHLKKLSDNGLNTWVSIEPYPTPDLDNQADKIERLLEKISFVKKLIFGKLNYRRLTEYNNGYSSSWKNNENFYWEMAKRVVNFCKRNNINYHIKFGTPLSQDKTKNLFKG